MNADDTQYLMNSILSSNMYSYCINNPISYVDYNGRVSSMFIVDLDRGKKISETIIMLIEMYLLALTNKNLNSFINSYDFSSKDIYIKKIKGSKLYQDFVNKYFDNINFYKIFDKMVHEHREYYYIDEGSINFNYDENFDLVCSIGDCNITVCIKKVDSYTTHFASGRIRTFYLSIQFVDVYDFHEHSLDKFVDVINNFFGYYPQEIGMLSNYVWYLNINYTYQFICPHGY